MPGCEAAHWTLPFYFPVLFLSKKNQPVRNAEKDMFACVCATPSADTQQLIIHTHTKKPRNAGCYLPKCFKSLWSPVCTVKICNQNNIITFPNHCAPMRPQTLQARGMGSYPSWMCVFAKWKRKSVPHTFAEGRELGLGIRLMSGTETGTA